MKNGLLISMRAFSIVALLLAPNLSNAAPPAEIPASDVSLPEVARGVPAGGALRVRDLVLDRKGRVDLDLERFEVFARDLVIEGADSLGRPDNAYFRGTIAGDPESLVTLTVPANGRLRGIAMGPGGTWILGPDPRNRKPGLRSKKMRKRENVRIRAMRFDNWDAEVDRALEVYNDAWDKNWGFVPVTDEEFALLATRK